MRTKNILLTLSLFVVATGFAQKIKDQKVSFDYIQLPAKPIDKSIKTHNSEAFLAYEEGINAEKKRVDNDYQRKLADHPAEVAAAEGRYNEDMVRYETELAAYNAKSTGNKLLEKALLNENNKPVKPAAFSTPAEPPKEVLNLQKVFSGKMLASTYLKLDGFTKGTDGNALKITATLYGFEHLGSELQSKSTSSTNAKTKRVTTTKTYWYRVQYKHPISIKIETPAGEVIIDETFEQFNEYSTANSPSKKNAAPFFNEATFVKGLQSGIVQKNMKVINDYINANYGFQKVKRNTEIFRIEQKRKKKFSYDDYEKAFQLALAGYNSLKSGNDVASSKLKEAISIWEAALTESDMDNKKARVNSDITIATMFNLAEAFLFSDQYDKVEETLNKMIGLDPSRKEKRLIESYRKILKVQKERWNANAM
jgi:hypothetical protein